MAKSTVWKAVSGASFLLVLIGLLIFLYSQSFQKSAIFPENTELWNKALTGYMVIFSIAMLGALIFVPEIVKELAKANYWKSFFWKFVPFSFVSIVLLILIKGVLKGAGSIDLLAAISNTPLSTIIVQCFVITQVEELLFGGLFFTAIQKKYGESAANHITAVGFGIFHFAKTGGNIPVMLTYIPLRYFFNYVRNYGFPGLNKLSPLVFGQTPKTQQANAGVHFAWNAFIIGFIKSTSL
jgi:membrane protease YdiL (CAAX protease family)